MQRYCAIFRIKDTGVTPHTGHVVGKGRGLRKIVIGSFSDKLRAVGIIEKNISSLKNDFLPGGLGLWHILDQG
jgi:hypothetical protein